MNYCLKILIGYIVVAVSIVACKSEEIDIIEESYNIQPYVQIKTPYLNEAFIRGDIIKLTASVYDLDSNLTSVYLFIDDSIHKLVNRNQIFTDNTPRANFDYLFDTETLTPGYHSLAVKAIDINKCFTDSIKFNLLERGTPSLIKDYDGNTYNSVKIGSQVWLTKDLKTTHFNDGEAIPLINYYLDRGDELEKGELGYAWYNNDSTSWQEKGVFYNFYAMKTDKLCPVGWHVSKIEEWEELLHYTDSVYGPFEAIQPTDVNKSQGYTNMSHVFRKIEGSNSNLYGFDATGLCSWWAFPNSNDINNFNSAALTLKGSVFIQQKSTLNVIPVRCVKNNP